MAKDDFTTRKLHRCSFCGKTQDQVRRLIAGPNAFICNECIMLCRDIIDDDVVSTMNAAVKNAPIPLP
ncbi:MAG: ATP-dependent Clp protease ATP-binding subunit ClpX, partial [Mailhella sp.]|nr:ATP-dependent Clp protease ATP-binding subunit ClpX [Mailhella sp.]